MTTTTPITRMLPNALHFSEFQDGYHGTCGETALATALVCATPPIETSAQAIALMLSITSTLRSEGLADATGATTTSALHSYATSHGFTPAPGYVSFQQPLDPATLHPYLLANAGVFPIVLELANAQALPGDEAGVHYHFLCVVGISPSGYVCNDGDNSAAPTRLVTYSWAELEAAIPCGLLGIEMKGAAMTLPTGWKMSGAELVDAAGRVVPAPFDAYIKSHSWLPDDVLEAEPLMVTQVEMSNPASGHGSVLYFRYSILAAPTGKAVYALYAGSEAGRMREMLAQKEAEIAALQKQVAAIPAPAAPAPAPLDPSVKNALAAALQLLQPQATLFSEIQSAIKTLG